MTTDGNPYAHAILRGGVDKYGTCIPNYHYEDLIRLLEMYEKWDLKNPAAIVDANHSNSNKKYKEQLRIVSEVLHSRNYNTDIKNLVKVIFWKEIRKLMSRGFLENLLRIRVLVGKIQRDYCIRLQKCARMD